jgi:hypothetical protein
MGLIPELLAYVLEAATRLLYVASALCLIPPTPVLLEMTALEKVDTALMTAFMGINTHVEAINSTTALTRY